MHPVFVKQLEAAFLSVVFVALCAWHFGGCATSGPNPCIGPYAARATMPCTCPGNLNPGCYPFPQDAKKPKKKTTDGGSR